jgi:hypothetical protein
MAKTLGIHLILAKDSAGNYTNDSLLFQDILRYSVRNLEATDSNIEYAFKVWTLTQWLISNNQEISNDYKRTFSSHMTTSNKIESRIGRVKRHIDILQYLGLIGEHSRTKESKGNGTTTLYSFTEFGLIVALLLLTQHANRKAKAINLLYNTLCKNFENSGSLGEYCLSFVRKMYDGGLFDKYLKTMLETAEKNNSIKDIKAFFANSLLLELNENDSKRFLSMKNEAFHSLSPEMKNRFMHLTKLDIESKMFQISNNIENFEKTRFEIRNNYEEIVVEGLCQKCKLYHVMRLSIIEYLDKINYKEYETGTCPVCKIDYTIRIPSISIL